MAKQGEDHWAARWRALGWKHDLWAYVRFYRALRPGERAPWLGELGVQGRATFGEGEEVVVAPEVVAQLKPYLLDAEQAVDAALGRLRDEAEANRYCTRLGVAVGVTRTRSRDHHQATKPLVAAVGEIARRVCERWSLRVVPNPQGRSVWLRRNHLHVTARRLDGAISSLINPFVVWEIKEYWGGGEGKAGGSKMSDAVYECHLVGLELRAFEDRSGAAAVRHVVFVDGRQQWQARRSDLLRLLDLEAQGLIDRLVVGRDVETVWESALEAMVREARAASSTSD